MISNKMTFVTFAPDTGSFGTPGYHVPIVVPQTEPEIPSKKTEEPIEKPLNDRNKRQGNKIQDYLNGDDKYKKSHKSSYTKTKKQLAEENRFLVVNIAKGFLGKGISLDDLVGEGNLGLMRAVEDYNPEFEFSTYAAYWIKHSMIRALHTELRGNLPIPYHICQNRKRINHIESVLEEELKRKPNNVEIAQKFNEAYYPDGPRNNHISDYHVEALKIAVNTPKSLTKNNGEGEEFQTSIEDKYSTPEEIIGLKEELEKAKRFYLDLDERDRTVLSLFYGLDGNDPKNCREIGDMLGYTRERIRQIHRDAIIKLRGEIYPEDKVA